MRVVVLAGVLMSLAAPSARGQEFTDSAAFVMLERVTVNVDLDDDLSRYVSPSRLQTILELELRRAGLTVVREIADGAQGSVSLNVLALPYADRGGEVTMFAVSSWIELRQPVTTELNASFTVATTWSRKSVHRWGLNQVRSGAEALARDYVDEMLNAYLAVR